MAAKGNVVQLQSANKSKKKNLFEEFKEITKNERGELEKKLRKSNDDAGIVLVKLSDLANDIVEEAKITKGIDELKKRTGGEQFEQKHFGRLGFIPISQIYINSEIQRLIEVNHIGDNILPVFDPRITEPLNVTYYPKGVKHPGTGKILKEDLYSIYDGQQTATSDILCILFGLIATGNDKEITIPAKIIDYDLKVPGSDIDGEAFANLAFRTTNGKGKKKVDPYYIMRSERNSGKFHGSTLPEDVHSSEMWDVLVDNGLLPAPDIKAERDLPGRITHISGMKTVAKHDEKTFNIKTFALSIEFIGKNFSTDQGGISASFYMGIAEWFKLLKEQKKIRGFNADQFAKFLREEYGDTHGFEKYAKNRHKNFYKNIGLNKNWGDQCMVPYLVDDYLKYCQKKGLRIGEVPTRDDFHLYVNEAFETE